MKRKISSKLAVKEHNYSYPLLDVNILDLEKTVLFLTKIRPYRNYVNTQSLDKVAAYIRHRFSKDGLSTTMQPFNISNDTYVNVIGSCGEDKQNRVIVGAHYDVCGDQPGADDNASAVARLLEIARLVKKHGAESKYRFDFVAYSLEEPPFFTTDQMGSYIHAQSLHNKGVSVQGMICLEMIGYFSTEEKSQDYPLFVPKSSDPSVGNFIAVVGNMKSGYLVDELTAHFSQTSIAVESLKAPGFIPEVDFSDHRNYWKFGYHAVMITDTAFYRNRNYHEKSDTIDTLDFDKIGEVVRGVVWTLLNLR